MNRILLGFLITLTTTACALSLNNPYHELIYPRAQAFANTLTPEQAYDCLNLLVKHQVADTPWIHSFGELIQDVTCNFLTTYQEHVQTKAYSIEQSQTIIDEFGVYMLQIMCYALYERAETDVTIKKLLPAVSTLTLDTLAQDCEHAQ